jgi:hypothetical protein
MPKFSKAFNLGKTQLELDFVDIPLHTDDWLFIDPFAISQRSDPWSQQAHRTLVAFFQKVVDFIRSDDTEEARKLLGNLREPNETHFGLSKKQSAGAGIGPHQADQIFTALKGSSAVKTGFLSSLEECELMIEGVGRDKISDLATNVIRGHLADYTRQQCDLHGIPVYSVAMPPFFNADTGIWESHYVDLPVWKQRPIILVPKAIARRGLAYDHQQYYQHYVLNYLQSEAISAGSSLVHTLRSGRRVVYKKDLAKQFPCTKEFLYQFSKQNPDTLEHYRSTLVQLEKAGKVSVVDDEDERVIADILGVALKSIRPGMKHAGEYHRLMVSVIEFLFFPNLLNPKKEREIHEGRKRIDILVENGAREGILHRLHDVRGLPCSFVPVECKNYTTEVANPELDQLAGRFSTNRGKFGMLCCRRFEDRALFIDRCRDTHRDQRGLIIALDDETLLRFLAHVMNGERHKLDGEVSRLIDEVWID